MQIKRTALPQSKQYVEGGNNVGFIDEDRMAQIIVGNSRFGWMGVDVKGNKVWGH